MRDPLSTGYDVLGLDSEKGAQDGAIYGANGSGSEPEPVSSSKPKAELPAAFAECVGKGRPRGIQNRLTRTMKAALEEAFEKAGGVDYLVKMALHGTATDRQAFMALIGRLLPMQINSNIDQRIRVELPWLMQRGIGKTDSSGAEALALVGKGRTIDAEPAGGQAAGGAIDDDQPIS